MNIRAGRQSIYCLLFLLLLNPVRVEAQEIFSFPIDFELQKKFPPNQKVQVIGTWEETYIAVKLFQTRRVNYDLVRREIEVTKQEIKNVSGEVVASRWSATLGPFNASEQVELDLSIIKKPSHEQMLAYDNTVAAVRDKVIAYINNQGSASLSPSEIQVAFKPIFSVFDSESITGLRAARQDTASLTDFLWSQSVDDFAYIRQASLEFENAVNMFTTLGLPPPEVSRLRNKHHVLTRLLREQAWTVGEAAVQQDSIAQKYRRENLPESVVQNYAATLRKGFELELQFKAAFDSIVAETTILLKLTSDPYAFTVDEIKDWITVEMGLLVAPWIHEMIGTFNISILFSKRRRDYPYSFANFCDWRNRLNFNVGTKLFDVDGERFAGTPFHAGLGYKLNRFVAVGSGALIFKDNGQLKAEPFFSVNADILVAKFILSEFSKALNLFSESDGQ